MMTYKEALFFTAKCLTINHEEKNLIIVKKAITSDNFDWDSVVKLSTAHYVFPALYCNLKRANLLEYLPEELVNYMKHITSLNRERNQQIIEQAKEINELLLENDITPIFLKGAGNLLEGLYDDIAERMVGDIDFIFSEKDYSKAIEVLLNDNYSKVRKTIYDYPQFKHYPRLQKKGKIAAVEIHKELLLEKYAKEFNYKIVSKDTIQVGNINVMSNNNQLALSIIAKQINDDGYYFKNIALRNGYDIFLMSKKTDTQNTIKKFNLLFNPLNCFLASCYIAFGEIDSLKYFKTKKTNTYLHLFEKSLANDTYRKKYHKKQKVFLFIKGRASIILKSFYKKEYIHWLYKRVSDKKWRNEKLIQLGFSKPNP